MPTYRYIAQDAVGARVTGSVEASSSIDAVNQLRARGLRIERIDSEESPILRPETQRVAADQTFADAAADGSIEHAPPPDIRLGVEDLAEIAGRIAGITRSNLPLTPGLRALSDELPSRSLRRGIRQLCERLERGEPLEQALEEGGAAIPRHISGLILLGIYSGRLGEIMDWFLQHVRRQIDLRRRCRASLLYPVVLMAAGLGAFSFGLMWIVPEMRTIYKDFGTEFPSLTTLLFAISDLALAYGVLLLGGAAALVIGIPLLMRLLGGKVLQDRILAGTPLVGTMFRCSALAGFCELLSIFVSGKLPLADGVRMAGQGCGDADLQTQFAEIAECLELGADDGELYRRLANISPQLIHVFHWKGREETFGEALRGAGRIYENQAQMQIALGGMFLEPVVIFGVVGGIGFFVLSLFLPLIQLLNELS